VSDGLFTATGAFYVMPSSINLKPLEEIFRANLLKMLKNEGRINDEIINNLLSWKNSGFSVNNDVRIARDDDEGQITLAQYIIRNTFSVEKLTYNEQSGMVIYHSKMSHGKDKKNFAIYTAEEFIAAITQHIPSKSFQMIRYYGWYSNKNRGMREKQGILGPGDERETKTNVEIIDVSDYSPPRIPSKTWRECIKRIWEIDALQCPNCGGSMKILAFITENKIIKKILEHLDLWRDKSSRDPPNIMPEDAPIIYEPLYDDPRSYDDF